MEIKRVCVLGAGLMGHGIAQVCAQGGFEVTLEDISEQFLQKGLGRIKKFLTGSVERKKITQEEAEAVLNRIRVSTSLKEAAGDADLVIEAIVENMKIKKETFKQLDEICPEHTIFATNTSYQSVAEIASVTGRPDRFLGMHWFNPPQVMKGVEVVKTERTSPETVRIITDLCRQLGKEPAVCRDSPGFIANRLLQAWRSEGLRLCDENAASFQDIDTAFKTAYSYRMGPFELADLAGMDVVIAGNETMYNELKSDVFKPPRCAVAKLRSGELGRKTGKGFYEYQ